MFYSTTYHITGNFTMEVAISGRLTNQKPGKKNQSEYFFIFHYTCLISNNTKFCTIVVASTGFSFPDILFSLSASYNLIMRA